MATTAQITVPNGATRSTPRLALTRPEAAQALGVSVDFFDDHLAHELRCIRRGRLRLYPLAELQRWVDVSADRDGRS